MRILSIFLILLFGATYFLFDQWLAPQLRGPVRIGESLLSVQEQKLALDKQAFSITQANIVEETDKRVVVQFTYQGKDPNWHLNACGDIEENNMHGPWGCEPRVLQVAGDGKVDIGFVLANGDTVKGRSRECSDTVSVSVYGRDGSVFYRHKFALKKIWHQVPGMWSWYRYRHEGCPVRNGM